MEILVLGAGIGGLGASAALRQRGFDVDLVEIKPTMSVYADRWGTAGPGEDLFALGAPHAAGARAVGPGTGVRRADELGAA